MSISACYSGDRGSISHWGDISFSLRKVSGCTQVPDYDRKSAHKGTWGLPPRRHMTLAVVGNVLFKFSFFMLRGPGMELLKSPVKDLKELQILPLMKFYTTN